MKLCVQKILLSQFRCFEAARLDINNNMVVLYGANGAGKTNILEAISLLTPGKGLRDAKTTDLKNKTARDTEYWAISSELQTPKGVIKIGTGQQGIDNKRIVRINGHTEKTQSTLAQYVSAIWLTPQMDRIFIGSPSERRRFFDRLVFAYDPKHITRINAYERSMRERSKLLRHEFGTPDPVWLSSLEAKMAQTGIAIAAARQILIDKLQAVAFEQKSVVPLFPVPLISIKGWVEGLLESHSALEVEAMFAQKLECSRNLDAATGGAMDGVHRSDFLTYHADHNLPADQCSTGEQKGLLLSITLAHARLIHAEFGHTPLLLLDEVVAHLDKDRRKSLIDLLYSLNGQCWMTGTDLSLFSDLTGKAQFIHIKNASIMPIKNTQTVA